VTSLVQDYAVEPGGKNGLDRGRLENDAERSEERAAGDVPKKARGNQKVKRQLPGAYCGKTPYEGEPPKKRGKIAVLN